MNDNELMEMTIEEVRALPAYERMRWKRTRLDWLGRQRTEDRDEVKRIKNKIWRTKNYEKLKEYYSSGKGKEASKRWYKKNKLRVKEYNKEYYRNNKEKIKEYHKREEVKEKKRKYYRNNKEKIKEYHKREEVKEKKRKYYRLYYKRKKEMNKNEQEI